MVTAFNKFNCGGKFAKNFVLGKVILIISNANTFEGKIFFRRYYFLMTKIGDLNGRGKRLGIIFPAINGPRRVWMRL